MTIKELLREMDVSPVIYLAFVRQESLRFIPKRQRRTEDFRLERLMALKAFSLLRECGFKAAQAADAVMAGFPEIVRFVELGKLASEDAYGISSKLVVHNRKLEAVPVQSDDLQRGTAIGTLTLDLRGILQLIPDHVRQIGDG
ncbi:hypothetical protein G7077_11430 [Sphingomonas piscis]|uniref:Uncharacterized protein n=1 Tax=Sphingomonas piscis TaxID=2714943 RepID=A0A6G7YRQ7_9SPHN|nr:hypothetical protein [Sphingomonas piscis]QIK79423.1 hypothetical protein G7077_11430 [Sphingomonas piscis]